MGVKALVSRSVTESQNGPLWPMAILMFSNLQPTENMTDIRTPPLIECSPMIASPGNTRMPKRSFVPVIDDDESVRESLPDLLSELGFTTKAFASAEDFLESDSVSEAECLIVDVAMPGMSGPALQQELKRRGIRIPIIFITAHADAAVRARLIKQGAVECLFKPFSDTMLRDALNVAIRRK